MFTESQNHHRFCCTKCPLQPYANPTGSLGSAQDERRREPNEMPKTEKPRCIKIPAMTMVVIGARPRRRYAFRQQFGPDYQAGDLVFATPDGSPLKPDSVSATVSLLFRRLKLPAGLSLHSLRHTHTSELLDGGGPLPGGPAPLGHSSNPTTQETYAH